jgi:dihydrodipicolinate synthase/N-acetylneuraminate lyase
MEKGKPRELGGAVPIVPIPFDEADNIDEEGLRRLVEFAAGSGFAGVCLPAYGSEFYKLSDEERIFVVKTAVDQAAGRLLVVAQSNHGASRIALQMARKHVENGADLISVAVPRTFALSDEDLVRYFKPVLNGVDVPSLVQDYYPTGSTVGPNFVSRLSAECPLFHYLKLEEPQVTTKIVAIAAAVKDRVKVLDGMAGLYLMELIPAGVAGVMSGMAIADALNVVFQLRLSQRSEEAFELYQKLLPFIVFGLQNFELWLYCEKRLLQARGLISSARCRNASVAPDLYTIRYVDELGERIMHTLQNAGLSAKAA